MKHRIMGALLSWALAFSFLGAAALVSPVYAGDTTMLAGRPISGSAFVLQNPSCHGISYGRVNGALVLFTADHCRQKDSNGNDTANGDPVYGPNGSQIGTWGPWFSSTANNDLTYIILNSSSYPSVRNQIYHGGTSYWTITQQPAYGYSCAAGVSLTNYGVYQNWQPNLTDHDAARLGSITKVFSRSGDGCTFQTSLVYHGDLYIDSGSPWSISALTNQVWGISTARTNPGDYILVSPVYDGLLDLDTYWEAHGNFSGAYVCTTASC